MKNRISYELAKLIVSLRKIDETTTEDFENGIYSKYATQFEDSLRSLKSLNDCLSDEIESISDDYIDIFGDEKTYSIFNGNEFETYVKIDYSKYSLKKSEPEENKDNYDDELIEEEDEELEEFLTQLFDQSAISEIFEEDELTDRSNYEQIQEEKEDTFKAIAAEVERQYLNQLFNELLNNEFTKKQIADIFGESESYVDECIELDSSEYSEPRDLEIIKMVIKNNSQDSHSEQSWLSAVKKEYVLAKIYNNAIIKMHNYGIADETIREIMNVTKEEIEEAINRGLLDIYNYDIDKEE